MKGQSTLNEIHSLFANTDPDKVWEKLAATIGRINPDYDFKPIQGVYTDIISLFRGQYPGYSSIRTLYHDMPHTLDVILCAVRLMHGVHLAGIKLSDDEITLILIAVFMHDIGYAQREGDDMGGTGAQFTQVHVRRGIEFMKHYLAPHRLPARYASPLEPMILSTDPSLKFADIAFPDERSRLLGQIVVTADLTGQMADRTYLEKLLFLYLEFKEANFGNFQSVHDMLRQTKQFYELTRAKLDGPFGGLYVHLALYFREVMGEERNFYLESIEKNIAYLEKVIAHDEAEYLSMLKRGGIVEKAKSIIAVH